MDLIDFIFSVLFFIVMYLEYQKSIKMPKELKMNSSLKLKLFLLSFFVISVLAIYFLAYKMDSNGFDIVLLILKIFVYIAISTYLLIFALGKLSQNKLINK